VSSLRKAREHSEISRSRRAWNVSKEKGGTRYPEVIPKTAKHLKKGEKVENDWDSNSLKIGIFIVGEEGKPRTGLRKNGDQGVGGGVGGGGLFWYGFLGVCGGGWGFLGGGWVTAKEGSNGFQRDWNKAKIEG